MPRKKTYQWQADGEAEHEAAPSRSAKKRQSLALQNLGEELTRLAPAELRDFDLPPDLLEALALYARIRDHEGRRRQMQYIGRLMRETDAERLRAALAARREAVSADTARFHLVEQWRERLLAAPEADVEGLLQTILQAMPPLTDGQAVADRPTPEELRRLVREAREARAARKATAGVVAPHASRALFRALNRALAPASGKD